jgi:uncharacterized protein (DUF4415 family)
MSKPPFKPREPSDPRKAAEAAFRKTTDRMPDPVSARPAVPGAKELVSLRIDRDVLDHFQGEGPGWQDRINAFLRGALPG